MRTFRRIVLPALLAFGFTLAAAGTALASTGVYYHG